MSESVLLSNRPEPSGFDSDTGSPVMTASEPAGKPESKSESEPEGLLLPALARWFDAQGRFGSALLDYANEVGEAAGIRVRGGDWARAIGWATVKSLRLAPDKTPDKMPDKMPDSKESLELMFDYCDSLELSGRNVAAAAAIILDPAVASGAASGWSRSYSDNLGRCSLRAGEADRAAQQARRAAIEAAAAEGGALGLPIESALVPAFMGSGGRGGVSTELYLSALSCARARHDDEERAVAIRRMDESLDIALGCEPDSKESAAAAASERGKYHPLQVMNYSPSAFREDKKAAPTTRDTSELKMPELRLTPEQMTASLDSVEPPLMLTLPQARLCVRYNLGPLIDLRQALDFGPIVPLTSGLSYRLVERLRTISAAPLLGRGADMPGRPHITPVRATPLAITLDGRTPKQFSPPHFTATASHFAATAPPFWAPCAGPPQRASARAKAEETVIVSRILAESKKGPPIAELRRQFETEPVPDADQAIVETLLKFYDIEVKRAPPETARDFTALLVPAWVSPAGYMYKAHTHLAQAAARRALDDAHTRPPRITHAELARESYLTLLATVDAAAREFWIALRRAAPSAANVQAACAEPPIRREVELRRIAKAAFETAHASVAAAGSPSSSLKLYVARAPAGY